MTKLDKVKMNLMNETWGSRRDMFCDLDNLGYNVTRKSYNSAVVEDCYDEEGLEYELTFGRDCGFWVVADVQAK